MIVCIDTNVAIQSLARGHAYFPILRSWVRGRFIWAVRLRILISSPQRMSRIGRAPSFRVGPNFSRRFWKTSSKNAREPNAAPSDCFAAAAALNHATATPQGPAWPG